MTSFQIDHNGYADLNMRLAQQVSIGQEIITNLNNSLRRIDEAVQGNAASLWNERQLDWNRTYERIQMQLANSLQTSRDVHQIFGEGDSRGARIMMG
ncbi:hypothetical protein V1227_06455 [Lentzea sp. DG1S-22]|uniref:hypothetical protein n=1 Tax=Lentzea sp. DG1S-22 TaxID=3108822 RepID=UPI002E78A815|nr:hypothetical protein [Lentzea sp. DG1S-22]WVH82394.1 hypothetical protein V1227_06455 [Lentzea sp. DG1S-22]